MSSKRFIKKKILCRFVYLFCFVFFISLNSYAKDEAIKLKSSEDVALKSLEHLFKNVFVKTLDNGLTIIMYKRGYAPVFSGIVSVRVGGSDEHVGKTGISHFFEHLAFKGTDKIGTRDYKKEKKLLNALEELSKKTDAGNKFSKAQKKEWDNIHQELKLLWNDEAFSKEYEKRGASGFNASTDKDITRYYVSFPKKELDFWAKMETERILSPVIRQFYEERDVILEERKMRFENSPEGKMYEKFLGVMFLNHPYRNPVIGFEEDIKHLVPLDIINFQKKYYIPSNMVVAVVGDVDFKKDFKILEKYFSKIPVGEKINRNVLKEPFQDGERRVNLNIKSNPSIYIAYHKPNYPHKDDLVLSLLSQLIAGSKISPLYKELVKDSKCASSIGIDEGPGSAYPNYLAFYITPNGKCSNDKIISIFDKEMEKIRTSNFSKDDLEIAIRRFLVSTVDVLNSNEDIAKMLAETKLLYGDYKAVLYWMKNLKKVSLKDLKKTMNRYLIVDNRTIATIGK